MATGTLFGSLANGMLLALTKSPLEGYILERLKPTYRDSIYTDLFLSWAGETDEQWAACINYMDAHIPYQPRNEHDRFSDPDQTWEGIGDVSSWDIFAGEVSSEVLDTAQNLYDGCIRQVDAEIERLLRGLRENDEYEDTLVVIASDHGEAFGEPNPLRDCQITFHGTLGGLNEEILHVPLLVKPPGGTSGREVDRVVSLLEFPRVVRDVLSGMDPNFRAESPVRAYMPPEPPDYPKGKVDPVLVTEWMDAVYRMEDGSVRKYVRWNDRERVVACRDAQTSDVVAEEFDQPCSILRPDQLNVLEDTEEESEMFKQRLEDLGYIE